MFQINNKLSHRILFKVAQFLAQLPISTKSIQRIAIVINFLFGILGMTFKLLFAGLVLWLFLPYLGFPLSFLQCVIFYIVVGVLRLPLVKEKTNQNNQPYQIVQIPPEILNAVASGALSGGFQMSDGDPIVDDILNKEDDDDDDGELH